MAINRKGKITFKGALSRFILIKTNNSTINIYWINWGQFTSQKQFQRNFQNFLSNFKSKMWFCWTITILIVLMTKTTAGIAKISYGRGKGKIQISLCFESSSGALLAVNKKCRSFFFKSFKNCDAIKISLVMHGPRYKLFTVKQ